MKILHSVTRARAVAIGVVMLAVCLAAGGCLGPEAVKRTRIQYNEVYRSTNDEQLLLNIVRLRYADSPIFIDLPNITSQFEVNARGQYLGGVGNQFPGHANLGIGEMLVRDAPTLSYHPRDGQEIGKALITPLTAETLRVISPGANTEQFLTMAVNEINDVNNAPNATSMTPRVPDDNSQYRYAVSLLVALENRNAVELAVGTYDTDLYDAFPIDQLSSRDALAAVKDGYTFRTDGSKATLQKRETTLVLRIKPAAMGSWELAELTRIFHLIPGRQEYKLKTELTEAKKEEAQPDLLGSDTLVLDMRSVWQIMTFLSKGVCVPAEHVVKGIAPNTPLGDGTVYDWTQTTRGLFFVSSQKHRPKDVEVAVEYNGYWFYIAKNDVDSRAALALLELMFALQEAEREQLGPVLTLPIN